MNLMSLTAVALGEKIKAKEVTAVEAAQACIAQIKEQDKEPWLLCNGSR